MHMRHTSGLAQRHTCQVGGYLEVGLRLVEGYLEVGWTLVAGCK